MQEFRGKTAVVTGAGSGIGRALCLAFAAEGMHVAMADIDADALAGSGGHGEHRVSLRRGDDLHLRCERCRKAVDALADAVFDRWGQVDVLCNNAGVFVGGLIWDRPAGRLRIRPRRQPLGDPQRDPVLRAPDDRPGDRRPRGQHLLGGRPLRSPVRGALRHFEVRRLRRHRVPGPRPPVSRVEYQGIGAVSGDDHHQHRRPPTDSGPTGWSPISPRTRSSSPTTWPGPLPAGWILPRWQRW